MPDQLDIVSNLTVSKYAPRPDPLPVPTPAWNDEPLMCLKVNDEWVSHIIGVLIALDQSDAWIGDEDAVFAARQQVNEIILAFMEDCDPMSNCCPEPLQRVTEDGVLQVSYDGGETWSDATTEDPRTNAPQLPPIAGDDGDEKRCQAANNVLGQFKDGIATFEGYFDTTATVVEFVTAVATAICTFIFAPLAVPLVVSAIIALMAAVWNAGKTAYTGAFDDTVYGKLLCILYCHVSPDGTFTSEALDAIRSRISADFDPIARDAFLALLNGVQVAGLNNMARIPTGSSASCDSCDCDCDGVEVVATWITFFGTEIEHSGCHFRASDATDGAHQAVTWDYNSTTPATLANLTFTTPPSGAITYQYYLADLTGPILNSSAPIGLSLSNLEVITGSGDHFDVSTEWT